MSLPDLEDIKDLMQKTAKKNCILEEVEEAWDHEACVWNFSKKIADLAIKNGYKVDLDFLKIACYIHDLGRMISGSKSSKEFEPARYHGMRGYELAREQGWPEKLARVCVRHMGGAGQPKDVNREIGFGNKATLATTTEERILAYADSRTFFNPEKRRADIYPFKVAYDRFKVYPDAGELLLKNHDFVKKITRG